MKVVLLGNYTFDCEIAGDANSRAIGLSQHDELKDEEGMLFVFDKLEEYAFTTMDMDFDLDIVWIAENKVVGFTNAVMGKIYYPPEPVDMVLEVNSGMVKESKAKIGDIVIVL